MRRGRRLAKTRYWQRLVVVEVMREAVRFHVGDANEGVRESSLPVAERIESSRTLRGTEEEDTTPDVFRTDQAPLT